MKNVEIQKTGSEKFAEKIRPLEIQYENNLGKMSTLKYLMRWIDNMDKVIKLSEALAIMKKNTWNIPNLSDEKRREESAKVGQCLKDLGLDEIKDKVEFDAAWDIAYGHRTKEEVYPSDEVEKEKVLYAKYASELESLENENRKIEAEVYKFTIDIEPNK